jgi:hypothetical protein
MKIGMQPRISNFEKPRKTFRALIFARACGIVCCAVLFGAAFEIRAAAPFAQYQQRVYEANLKIDDLIVSLSEDKIPDEKRVLNEVRILLPPTETVEWSGKIVNVDNRWLHQLLDQYQNLGAPPIAAKDAKLRRQILNEVGERLHSLQSRLGEISEARTTPARDMDADKGRLNAILHRKEFAEKAQDSAFRRLLQRFLEWLQSFLPRMKPLPTNSGASSLIVLARLIIYGLIVALIVFVFWRFVLPLLKRRAGRRKRESTEARIVLGERLAADESAASLLREADALARAGDWRGAIRKAYIALLCELGDRKIVRLAQHKTNRDYLRDVRERRALYGEMELLTENFERHWYGFIEATANDWTNFRAHCQSAISSQ